MTMKIMKTRKKKKVYLKHWQEMVKKEEKQMKVKWGRASWRAKKEKTNEEEAWER